MRRIDCPQRIIHHHIEEDTGANKCIPNDNSYDRTNDYIIASFDKLDGGRIEPKNSYGLCLFRSPASTSFRLPDLNPSRSSVT